MNCSKQQCVGVATGQPLSIWRVYDSMCGNKQALRWDGDSDKVASSYRMHTN